MRLRDAQDKFDELRKDPGNVVVRRHAWADHPERRFKPQEIKELVSRTGGILRDNHVDKPAPDSFVWHCKDADARKCEVTLKFEETDTGDLIIVISAFRRIP